MYLLYMLTNNAFYCLAWYQKYINIFTDLSYSMLNVLELSAASILSSSVRSSGQEVYVQGSSRVGPQVCTTGRRASPSTDMNRISTLLTQIISDPVINFNIQSCIIQSSDVLLQETVALVFCLSFQEMLAATSKAFLLLAFYPHEFVVVLVASQTLL